VYVSWSNLAGQSHGQWGLEFPGMLQFSLRPGILDYCPGAGAAEFSSFRRRLHTSFNLILNLFLFFSGGFLIPFFPFDT